MAGVMTMSPKININKAVSMCDEAIAIDVEGLPPDWFNSTRG